MAQEEALDTETRVSVRAAIDELSKHGHDARVGKMKTVDGQLVYEPHIHVNLEVICTIKDETVSTFDIMAWLGY